MVVEQTLEGDRVTIGASTRYEIVFTERFYKNVRAGWPAFVLSAFNQLIREIAENPHQPRRGIKSLALKKHQYRLRFSDWRLIYSLDLKGRQMRVERISIRGEAYTKGELTAITAIAGERKTKEILKWLATGGARGPVSTGELAADELNGTPVDFTPCLLPDSNGTPEDIPGISASEVISLLDPISGNDDHPQVSYSELLSGMLNDPKIDWLLNHHGVDISIKGDLHSCTTDEEFDAIVLPASLRDSLEELMTGSERDGTDIERLYKLGDADFGTLAARPLHSFLLHLDEAQEEIVNKPLAMGPFLVKGAAGTGKTLVCLYRLRRMVLERMNESLFDQSNPIYLFVTYTNALVGGSESLYKLLMRDLSSDAPTTEFMTVDRVVNGLRREHGRGKFPAIPGPFSNPGRPLELLECICKDHPKWEKFSETRSIEFLMREFDFVIYGNDLRSVEDYQGFERRSQDDERLGKVQKALIWDLFSKYHDACLGENSLTYNGIRREVLRRLEDGEFKPATTYSHIFIDEVQDLPDTVLRLFRLLVQGKEQLTLASDLGQSIYRKSASLVRAHPELKFNRANSHVLQRSYRMSSEIQQAIAPLRKSIKGAETEPTAIFSGQRPTLTWCPPQAMSTVTADLVGTIHREMMAPLGSIAIILRSNPKDDDPLFAELKSKNIPYTVFGPQNRNLELGAEKVHIITAHSVKGLEFPHVVIPNVSGNTFPSWYALRSAKAPDEILK